MTGTPRRWLVKRLVVMGALLLGACGSAGTEADVQAEGGSTVTSTSAVAAVDLAADKTLASPPLEEREGAMVAVLTQTEAPAQPGGPTEPVSVVARLHPADDQSVLVATVSLPSSPTYPLRSDADVQVGDVTGDGHDDVLVLFDAAQVIGAVLSEDGGEWRFLPAAPSAGQESTPYVGVDPQIEGGTLTVLDRDCDCRVTLRWDGESLQTS